MRTNWTSMYVQRYLIYSYRYLKKKKKNMISSHIYYIMTSKIRLYFLQPKLRKKKLVRVRANMYDILQHK